MKIVNLYRYENPDDSITISPIQKDENDTTNIYRVIADEGNVLTDGVNTYSCVDTNDVSRYDEIAVPIDAESLNIDQYQKAAAFDYLTGRSGVDE